MFFIELKRAIFNIRFLVLIILSVILFLFSSYDVVWRGAVQATKSEDLTSKGLEQVLEYSSNKYHIWLESYRYMSIIFPIIIVWPYLYSLIEERNNKFRYFVISRFGRVKYLANKFLVIGLSGGFVLAFPEILYYTLLSIFARNDILNPFQLYPVGLYSYVFPNNPDLYIFIIILVHFLIGFAYAAFAIGIASFFDNKISVLFIPFAVYLTLDIIISSIEPIRNYAFLTSYMCMFRDNYSLQNLLVINLLYLIVGITLFSVNEMRRLKNG